MKLEGKIYSVCSLAFHVLSLKYGRSHIISTTDTTHFWDEVVHPEKACLALKTMDRL